MPRRLTALFVSLLLLSSMIVGGGADCVVGGRGPSNGAPRAAGGAGHGAHLHGVETTRAHHAAHEAGASEVSEEPEGHAPAGLPHAPAPCVSVAACGIAVVVTETPVLDSPPHAADVVAADVTLAPDSPALGLEPPPPRA